MYGTPSIIFCAAIIVTPAPIVTPPIPPAVMNPPVAPTDCKKAKRLVLPTLPILDYHAAAADSAAIPEAVKPASVAPIAVPKTAPPATVKPAPAIDSIY